MTACRVRVEAGHDRRARGRAHRLGAIRAVDDEALVGKAIQVRRLNRGVAVAGQRVGPLFVRKYEQQVWLLNHYRPPVARSAYEVPLCHPDHLDVAWATGAACASASAGRLRGCLCTLGVLLRLPLLAQAGVFLVGEIASALRTRSGKRVVLEGALGVAAT